MISLSLYFFLFPGKHGPTLNISQGDYNRTGWIYSLVYFYYLSASLVTYTVLRWVTMVTGHVKVSLMGFEFVIKIKTLVSKATVSDVWCLRPIPQLMPKLAMLTLNVHYEPLRIYLHQAKAKKIKENKCMLSLSLLNIPLRGIIKEITIKKRSREKRQASKEISTLSPTFVRCE